MIDHDLANKIKTVLLSDTLSRDINLISENKIIDISFNFLTEKNFSKGMEFRYFFLHGN